MTGQTENGGIKNVERMIPLKYLSNFWRTLEIPLIKCEINLILTWSEITLSQKDNAKLLQQLKSGFKRVINCNKYLSKPELLAPNPNLNHF